jgi:hypothetical protein
MNYRYICTVHQVEFGAKPTAQTDEKNLEKAKMPVCPVCYWNERKAMSDEIDSLRKQRECLVLAIELKQKHISMRI